MAPMYESEGTWFSAEEKAKREARAKLTAWMHAEDAAFIRERCARAWSCAHPGALDALRFELRKTLDEHGPASVSTPIRVERVSGLPVGTVECVLREGTGDLARTPQLKSPLRLPGGLRADIEYVGPDTVRILRTYTAPEKPRASTFGPLCKEGDCRKLACVAGGGAYCFEHTPLDFKPFGTPGCCKLCTRPRVAGQECCAGCAAEVAALRAPADPLDKVMTLRDLKEIHQEADEIHQQERPRAPATSYTSRAISARVYDAAKAASQAKPDPTPTIEIRHRRAAAALLTETHFAPLTWWIDGDRQTVRDADGIWRYYGAVLEEAFAPRRQLERVYQTALKLAKQGL